MLQYGRSFTLKDPSCNTPGGKCQFSGGANAGKVSSINLFLVIGTFGAISFDYYRFGTFPWYCA